jgi:hypothetical protein
MVGGDVKSMLYFCQSFITAYFYITTQKDMKTRMKRTFLILLCFLPGMAMRSMAQQPEGSELSYFLPQGGDYSYNKDIPVPEAFFGFQLGRQHAEWNQVVGYMKQLAAASGRVTVRETGRTHQSRPRIEVVITSPENRKNIDQFRAEHLKLADVNQSASVNTEKTPLVVSLMYSIHGNEPSGVNASIAVAYFLAAAQGERIEAMLEDMVVVMTPGLNPDGVNRFASWVNSSRSLTDVYDPNSREFQEPWPSSRTNHYWADCNRDWLMAQHPEGVAALKSYLDWLPNIVVDHHEQGPSRHFYFSPGHPKRTHPFTPQQNQDLTAEISAFCANELDKTGTLYYSKEGYDDFYYGKGASYGDIHGSVCLLYEQGSSRGHLRETRNGIIPFARTIRNQAYASYGTLFAGHALRERLLAYQREFYKNTRDEAAKNAVKGYVFDTRGSRAVAFHFLENMAHHRIDVYRLAKDVSADGKDFRAADAYVIPLEQKYNRAIRAIMENNLEYNDSIFYDISTWTFPHAFNLKYAGLKNVNGLLGVKVTENRLTPGRLTGGKSNYGYLFECNEFYSPKVIYALLEKGVRVAANSRPFRFKSGDTEKQTGYGALLVSVQNQPVSPDGLYELLKRLAAETGVDIHAAETGLMPDTDLGSPAYRTLKLPKVAVLVGRTMGIADCGEIWYLLDKRFQMRPALIESTVLTPRDLQRYTVIILPNGVPNLAKSSEDALKEWVNNGGTLIASGRACTWVNRAGLLSLKTEDTAFKEDSTAYRPYAEQDEADAGNAISGVILNCALDPSHPVGWGFGQTEIPVFKGNNIIFRKDADPYVSPLHYTSQPLLSGFLSARNGKLLQDAPAVFAKTSGNGAVIVFADDMNFRSYWFGTGKLFLNAVFFGECLKKENYNY